VPGIAEIAAVADEETLAFLDRFGLREAFESGDLRCSICDEPLLKAGLAAARGEGESVVFVCAKLDCQDEFYSR
jgi:hypothetical protein